MWEEPQMSFHSTLPPTDLVSLPPMVYRIRPNTDRACFFGSMKLELKPSSSTAGHTLFSCMACVARDRAAVTVLISSGPIPYSDSLAIMYRQCIHVAVLVNVIIQCQ